MIKAIFFDLWSTLAKTSNEWKKAYVAAGFENSTHDNKAFDEMINARSYENEEELAKTMCKLFGNINNTKLVESLLHKAKGKFYDDVIKGLQEIKNKGYKIGLITNTNNVDVKHFDFSLFDTVVISSEVGYTKPDKKIYLLACKNLVVDPSEAVMVGDSYNNDILAAKNAGIKGILIDRKNRYPDKKSIKTLQEILPLINNG